MNVVKFFNGIEHANLGKHSKNVKENLSSILNLEKNETSDSLFLAFSGIEIEHWKIILSQRNLFLLNSYNAAMYYYDKGIYDEDFLKNSKKLIGKIILITDILLRVFSFLVLLFWIM